MIGEEERYGGFDAALTHVRDAGLSHPDGQFLETFLQCAVDRDRAAEYFLRRCLTSGDGADDGADDVEVHQRIRELLSDWKFVISLRQSP